jgi:hypothetical protein
MNERIEQLAEQCWVHTNKPLFGAKSPHWEFDRQKFAELIVRECVQTLIDNTPERYTNESAEEDWDKGYDRAMKDCVHHIKEHFGVRE